MSRNGDVVVVVGVVVVVVVLDGCHHHHAMLSLRLGDEAQRWEMVAPSRRDFLGT